MATIRAISLRLKSVKSIQKITKSMKMVSAAKYSRAERELKAARPMGEGAEQFYVKGDVGVEPEGEKVDPEKKPNNLLYIAVTSDRGMVRSRGLCGAVHSSVSRLLRNEVLKHKEESTRIVCIGDKARGILQRQLGQHFLFVCGEVGRLPPTFLDASRIINEILKSDFEFDIGKIFYNKFRSVVSYATSEIPLFRLETVMKSNKVMNYEDADEETLKSFIEFSMASLLFYAMKEGACSEQSARMTAMDNSSKNAGEMIDKLTLTFNRTRQAVITRELIEIISGASAL